MDQKMRLFVAVPLPESVKRVLEEMGELLGSGLPRGAVRWVGREQMHLTLFFLGETGVSQLPLLQNELNLLASRHTSFTLWLNGVGAFPNRKKPRVIWAGLGGDVALLQALQADLTTRLVSLGWQAEKRPFRPHITLGRVKNHKKVAQMNWKADLVRLKFEVTAVHYFLIFSICVIFDKYFLVLACLGRDKALAFTWWIFARF